MVKAIGIDSGTKTMDIYGFDDKNGKVLIDLAIPRDEVTRTPSLIIDKLKETQQAEGSIDAIVGPSGYGMTLKKARAASESDIALATFVTAADVEKKLKIIGLREVMKMMKSTEELEVWFTPSVVHLTTVPNYRKANKIDMGTSDKVLTAVLAVKNQAERLKIRYDETNFILLEIGFAYTSALAIRNGQIVDAMAGTAGFPSYLGMGFLDSELAYALANTAKDFSKLMLFSGGCASVAGIDQSKPLEEFVSLAKSNSEVKAGYNLMMESIVKDVASLLPSIKPKEVMLSGRFVNMPEFLEDITVRLQNFFSEIGSQIDILRFQGEAKASKQAAEGAAVFANGIAHGKFEEIIRVMKLKESSGTIFDNLYLGEVVKEGLDIFKKL
ncbi:MAG: DUF1464 family protein [Candidatus Bathyarchaeia archaeon]|jgi:predicted butyrate kinase (DUF1464 family)